MQLGETKIICRIEHVVVMCRKCKELIWVSKKKGFQRDLCDDCDNMPKDIPTIKHKILSDRVYHGSMIE
jgi:hypothetical protein